MQAGKYLQQAKSLTQFYLKTGPHADTHTKRKETPESLFDPCSRKERQAGGSEFGGYLVVGGKACSVLRHLTKVVGVVPVARVGLVARGRARVANSRCPQNSSPRNSHREERTRLLTATVNKNFLTQPP